jgi:hypothetical protein
MSNIRVLEPIVTMPSEVEGQCLVWGQVWAALDDAGKDDLRNWEDARFYLTEHVRGGVITVNPGFVTGELTECRATYWTRLRAPAV